MTDNTELCPYPSWVWDEVSNRWNPPVPYPDTENWTKMFWWNEFTLSWEELVSM